MYLPGLQSPLFELGHRIEQVVGCAHRDYLNVRVDHKDSRGVMQEGSKRVFNRMVDF